MGHYKDDSGSSYENKNHILQLVLETKEIENIMKVL